MSTSPTKEQEESKSNSKFLHSNKRKQCHDLPPSNTKQIKLMKKQQTQKPEIQKIQVKLETLVKKVLGNFHFYRRYTQEIKQKALDVAEKFGKAKASRQTGIPESSIRRWKRTGTDRLGSSGRKPLYSQLEVELRLFFINQRDHKSVMTNRILLREARRIADRAGLRDFIGSISWLNGFKKRNQICYRRATRIG